jgi:hypothetical protein
MLFPLINILFSPVEIPPHNRQCVLITTQFLTAYNAIAGQGIKNADINQIAKTITGYIKTPK